MQSEDVRDLLAFLASALSTIRSGLLEEIGFGSDVPDGELASAWIERNDAQTN